MRRKVLSLLSMMLLAGSLSTVLIYPVSFAAERQQPQETAPQSDSDAQMQVQAHGKLAFVRQGQLWLRDENGERRISELAVMKRPQWSPDGQFIAVTGKSKGPHGKQDFVYLEVVNADTGKIHISGRWLYPTSVKFGWGPTGHQLAFVHDGVLSYVSVSPRSSVHKVAAGVHSFAWNPKGNGFIVSSSAHLLPDGWTQAKLYEVSTLRKKASDGSPKLMFTLPKTVAGKDRPMLITGIDSIKWSHDGKWLAFIAHPTADWAKDEDRLCVLSKDGKKFRIVGAMIHQSDWFRWSPGAETIAYIRGTQRDISHGKKLSIAAAPLFKSRNLAPIGAVDNGLTWIDPVHIIVSRHQESLPSKSPVQLESSMFPALFNIDVERPTVQNRITAPAQGVGDYNPISEGWQKVVWVRSPNESSKGEIWIGKADGTSAQLWLESVHASMWSVAPKAKKTAKPKFNVVPNLNEAR